MMKKLILPISLITNFLFVISFLMFNTSKEPSNSSNTEQLHIPTFDASLVQIGEDVSVLYELQSKYLPKMSAPASQYWKSSSNVMMEMSAEKTRIDELIRDELFDIYGDTAKTITAFEQYFYPLGPGYEFLSSDIQTEVATIRDAHRKSMMSLSRGGIESFNAAQSLEAAYWDQLKQILSPDQFLEFELRESRVAQQMRNIDFDWSESEFREVYQVKREQSNSSSLMGMRSGTLAYSEEIKSYLGEERYKEYLLAADPALIRFKDQAVKSGMENSDLQAAIDTYITYGEQISDAMQNNNRREVTRLNTERNREISDLTGLSLNHAPKLPFKLPKGTGAVKLN